MTFVRVLHFISVFIWVGSLLSLTRLFGYHVKESVEVQMRLVKLYKRMYYFVQFPMMILALVTGVTLMTQPTWHIAGWFHMKLTFVICLVAADICCHFAIKRLARESDQSRGIQYKILHGVTGLFLIGIAIAFSALKPRPLQQNEGASATAPTKELAKIETLLYDQYLAYHAYRFNRS